MARPQQPVGGSTTKWASILCCVSLRARCARKSESPQQEGQRRWRVPPSEPPPRRASAARGAACGRSSVPLDDGPDRQGQHHAAVRQPCGDLEAHPARLTSSNRRRRTSCWGAASLAVGRDRVRMWPDEPQARGQFSPGRRRLPYAVNCGAGDGNRTRTISLGS
jgi:hypothetical protein